MARGDRKGKMLAYVLTAILLVVAAVVINYSVGNYESAKSGVKTFLSLPAWVFPIVMAGAGLVIWWLGLNFHTDWPEIFGSGLVAGAVAIGQVMIGWKKFELGGMPLVPIAIPVLVFLLMTMIGMAKSR